MRVPVFFFVVILSVNGFAQTLEQSLLDEQPSAIAAAARESGDAKRGAILFHQVHIGCVKCHAVDGSSNSLGPDLTKLSEQKTATDEYVVTSILKPSADVRKGFETVAVVTSDGRTHTGLLVSRDGDSVILRDPDRNGEPVTFSADTIDEVIPGRLSIMPAGIANQLGSKQQFLDLVCYLLEVRDGGLSAAVRLQPPPGLIALTLPEYESHVDHAGLIRELDAEAFERGAAIYNRLCINCHGDHQRPGSLPTALRFADGKFKNGGDPFSMYRTLTHGFGFMVPQMWMVPTQKYDVIHYIRESYLRSTNPSQYFEITAHYLNELPPGDTFGPEAREYAPWADMNYGPSMINTFEIGSDGHNFAYKGIATRLDPGPGGIAKGNRWAIFDHDTLRFAAAWVRDPNSTAAGFVNWEGIHFDGRHSAHPRIVGDLQFENPTGPGWTRPGTTDFEDNARVVGRDNRRYGPLPREWAKYRGLHAVGDDNVVEYSVGDTDVLELAGTLDVLFDEESLPVFTRTMTLGAADATLTTSIATSGGDDAEFTRLSNDVAVIRPAARTERQVSVSQFEGQQHLVIPTGGRFDFSSRDFTVAARIRTREGGTIFCQAKPDGPWTPDGKSFFVRDGFLCYDIGWVGVVGSDDQVDDGNWHDVVLTWRHSSGEAEFAIDGRSSNGGVLRPKSELQQSVAKIGFTSDDFPNPSPFRGEIQQVAFWQRALSDDEIRVWRNDRGVMAKADGHWMLTHEGRDIVADDSGHGHDASLVVGRQRTPQATVLAGIVGAADRCSLVKVGGRLCGQFSTSNAADNMVVWAVRVDEQMTDDELSGLATKVKDRIQHRDLSALVRHPARKRWPEVLTTTAILGDDSGPFAVDALTAPVNNPWFARLRFGGHDFFTDGDRAAVCSWDGDVWLVSGLKSLRPGDASSRALTWQRIASGLFQPLGIKVIAGEVYVTCRDQLVILRDRNQDGETDFYECFNNDHQVTEHFHEFAMGLQQDTIGNFYYAKSARHALTALVPHHGTLLRIPSDGSRTEIIANGFRAANGVCLNPDGTFIVTDQEGHWNPKNRINWVHEGGFYGNMFGYHDVTDDSDDAMEQPLCWITNAFDRSPAELLWVDSDQWGPLNGSLLNLSYGYGRVYVVPHENIGGQMQGGMCELPIPQFPTGIMRGRFHPNDGQLYVCGLFAWASNQQAQEGGFYRLRYTGKPSYLPVQLKASRGKITIGLTEPVDRSSACDASAYSVKVWSLKRTANYGSDHYDEHALEVAAANLSSDGREITLTIPELASTWCMEIRCRLKTPDGRMFERVIHNTIHRLAE
ncbi:MAG: DUF6797 domain-containing protein [Planctomycetaceae bacterium]